MIDGKINAKENNGSNINLQSFLDQNKIHSIGKIRVSNKIVIQTSKTTFSLIYYHSRTTKKISHEIITLTYPIKKIKTDCLDVHILGTDGKIRIYYKMMKYCPNFDENELDISDIVTFSCYSTHILALNSQGNAFCLSKGNNAKYITQTFRKIPLDNVMVVSSGFKYSLLLTKYCVLYEITIYENMPTKIDISGVYSIKSWNYHSAVLTVNGIYTWDKCSKNARKIMIKNGVAKLENI